MKYFKASEFNCIDGTADCMCPLLLERLEDARDMAGIPFVINSAFRTTIENELAGGKDDSAHLYGKAVDIKAEYSRDRFLILRACILAGFTRIGIGKTFVHVDTSTTKSPQVIWMY